MDGRKLRILALLSGLCLAAAVPLAATPCSPTGTTLCLSAARFSVDVQWKDFQGHTGAGRAVSLTGDTGYFWFFSATNVELVVKVLDARAFDGHFWVFYGALSNVEYTMTVRDLATGDVRIYENSSGRFASAGDTAAFPLDSASRAVAKTAAARPPVGIPLEIDESMIVPAAADAAAACTPGATALCLAGGRFRVTAVWKDFQGNTGVGQAVALTSDTGYFWFFSSSNVELVVKALDGRVLNDHWWVFYGALSNVEYTMTVTDTVTGIVRTYENPSGVFASVGDVSAFGKPTTFQLIDGAVVKGEIGDETAFLYKVYAYFGDARLPQAYVGDPPPGDREHGILTDVVVRWPTLSDATRQALDPFLLPPIYPGSPFGQSAASKSLQSVRRAGSILEDWTRIDTARSAVWFRAADAGAATAANNLAAAIENVWTKETGLMGREPKSDAGKNNNGGDGKLDIYVLPSFRTPDPTDKPDGMAPPYREPEDYLPHTDPANVERASYILIRISAASSPEGARAVLSHEFFHAIAHNQKYADGILADRWLNEATATWMEDYVYPHEIRDEEHGAAVRYFTKGHREGFDVPEDGGYADYIFFFYVAHEKAPERNRDIWNNLVGKSSLDAIDTAIPGGFKERWPEFAMDCWNHPGVDQFNQWDSLSGLNEGSAEPYLGLSSGNGTGTALPSRVVPHLAMRYAFIEILGDTIQRVEIQNSPVAGGAANAKTQAWIKLANGTTRVEDWTGKPRVLFCRDKAEENVTGLMILYTNSGQRTPAVWGEGKVIASSVRCGGWRGTVRESRHITDAVHTASESMDVTAKFLPHPLLADHYYLAELSMRYTSTAQEFVTNCTLTVEPVTQTFTFGPDDADSTNEIVIDKSTEPPTYSATGFWGFIADARGECNGESGGTVPTGVGGEWWMVPPGQFQVKTDGSLSGNFVEPFPGGDARWTWSLAPD